MIGFETRNDANLFTAEPVMWDMQQIGDSWTPGWADFENFDKVFSQYETEEFKEYCTIMRDWYNEGTWAKIWCYSERRSTRR